MAAKTIVFRERIMLRIILATLLALPIVGYTAVIDYSLTWSGSGGYSLNGDFSYDDLNAADGAIRDTEVLSLNLEGFLNGVSQGFTSVNTAVPSFNFNFDTSAGQFFLGGAGNGPFGQNWNFRGNGIGFSAGGGASTMSVGNQFVGFIGNPSNLTATLVPVPSTLSLLLLAGISGMRRARRR